ncbi:class I SAM-dependent methyltransferase, partial [bacterium]|nr:class I SAM-dependent methyltransferase [bacterium]
MLKYDFIAMSLNEDISDSYLRFKPYLEQNLIQLLNLPSFRKHLDRDRFLKNKNCLTSEESVFSRTGTVNHNRNRMDNYVCDRSSKLINAMMVTDEFSEYAQWLDILSIGPRNENELYACLAAGTPKENIKAIDLISGSDWVEQGDMHSIKFSDNSFDVVIVGWVLAYSKKVELAVKEIARVLRPGGLIAIGWDTVFESNDHNAEDFLIQSEGKQIQTSKDIIDIFSDFKPDIIIQKDSIYPWSISGRQNICVIRLPKGSNKDIGN